MQYLNRLAKLMVIFGFVLHCGTVSANSANSANSADSADSANSANSANLEVTDSSAENFWVLGSYRNETSAQRFAARLDSELGLQTQVQTTVISGVTHYRLLAAEFSIDNSMNSRVEAMGVTPWLITVRSTSMPASTLVSNAFKPLPNQVPAIVGASPDEVSELSGRFHFALVGTFTNIDAALALERQLASEALSVRGEAKLARGQVQHQVWVGPTSDIKALQLDLNRLNLRVEEVRVAAASEVAYGERTRAPEIRKVPAKSTAAASSSNQYPKNFNLARLPEKKATPAVKP